MEKQTAVKVENTIEDGGNKISYYLKERNLLKVLDVFKYKERYYNNIVYRVRDLSRLFLDKHIDYLDANGLDEYMKKYHTKDYKKLLK